MALEEKIKLQIDVISDEDHIWVNGKQYISLKRVGEMIEEDRQKQKGTKEPEIDVAALLYKAADAIRFQEDILKLHDCNDCDRRRSCKYLPQLGQAVRINCPFWEVKR